MPIKNILRVFLITLALLLIPLGLQLTIGTGIDGQGWNWKPGDFVVVGALIFIFGLILDVIHRRAGKRKMIWIALVIFLFLWVYAELAVGVFTNWGS